MSKETMTNETMEMVTENTDVVIEAADAIVAGNDIDLLKVGKGLGIAVLVVGGGYLLVKKGIPAIKKFFNKDEAEMVECGSEDYTEAVSEDEVGVVDEETIE